MESMSITTPELVLAHQVEIADYLDGLFHATIGDETDFAVHLLHGSHHGLDLIAGGYDLLTGNKKIMGVLVAGYLGNRTIHEETTVKGARNAIAHSLRRTIGTARLIKMTPRLGTLNKDLINEDDLYEIKWETETIREVIFPHLRRAYPVRKPLSAFDIRLDPDQFMPARESEPFDERTTALWLVWLRRNLIDLLGATAGMIRQEAAKPLRKRISQYLDLSVIGDDVLKLNRAFNRLTFHAGQISYDPDLIKVITPFLEQEDLPTAIQLLPEVGAAVNATLANFDTD